VARLANFTLLRLNYRPSTELSSGVGRQAFDHQPGPRVLDPTPNSSLGHDLANRTILDSPAAMREAPLHRRGGGKVGELCA
jgi:hypothetical protein